MLQHDSPFYNYVTYASRQILAAIGIIIIGTWSSIKGIKLFGIFLLIFMLYFFRNSIPIIDDKAFVVSPSQSKITLIEQSKEYTYIETYLSPLDKHFLVGPVNGVIESIEDFKKDDDLESIRMGIRDDNGLMHYYDQIVKKPGNWGYITGILVDKRVIIAKKVGERITKGEHYGIIRFGSMMRYYIPAAYGLKVKVGDKLSQGNGITIL